MKNIVCWRKKFFLVGIIVFFMLMMSSCSSNESNHSFNGEDTHRTEQTGITNALTGIINALNGYATNQAPAITSADSTEFTVGFARTFTVTATGTPTPTFALTGDTLPSGITFNNSTGVLSGTPASGTNGIYYLTITASNGVSPNATQNFTLTITLPLKIGDSYGGGRVAYILVEGDPGYDANIQHGLIAATTDQSAGILWYNGANVTTGANGTALGTGLANTNTIIAVQGVPIPAIGDYAANIARVYNGGGYSDWYLPSKDELNFLFINRVAIGGFAGTGSVYWSSSEADEPNSADHAWARGFAPLDLAWSSQKNGCDFGEGPGCGNARVRAVRSF